MRTTDNFSFGDIVLADIEFTDKSGSKLRPVLVLYKNREDITVLKMTSQHISWDKLTIPIDDYNKLREETTIDLTKVITFHETIVHHTLGKISSQHKTYIKKYRSSFVQSW